jgi:hypothetical protein
MVYIQAEDDKMAKGDLKGDFLAEISKLWPVARGSLSYVRKPCVRPNCPACARGDKHPSWIFSLYDRGKQRCLYVPQKLVPTLRKAIANGREVEQLLAEYGAGLVYEDRKRRKAASSKREG